MNDKEYKIPTREWYTLKQAIKRIKQLTGEDLEIEDLVHYWLVGKINFAVNVSFSSLSSIRDTPSHFFMIGKNKIPMNNLLYCNFHKYDSYLNEYKECKYFSLNTNLHYCSFSERNLNTALLKQNELISFDKDHILRTLIGSSILELEDQLDEDGYTKTEVVNYDIHDLKGFIYIYPIGLAGIAKTQSYLLEQEILETGLSISDISNFFLYDEKNDKFISVFIMLEGYKLHTDDIFITEKSLDLFLTNDHQLKPPSFEIKKKGRPQHSIKSLILAIGEETFKKNPQQSTNKLATAIYDYIEKVYFEEYGTVSQRAVNDYLKDAKIGKENARNRSKVIIYDPFKSE